MMAAAGATARDQARAIIVTGGAGEKRAPSSGCCVAAAEGGGPLRTGPLRRYSRMAQGDPLALLDT